MIHLEQIRAIDTQGMWDRLCTFDEQWRDAVYHTQNAALNIEVDKIRDVVITGMGGAIIGGDIIRAICLEVGHLPVHINKSYSLPSFVADSTLVIAISQSGNTEETLSAFEEAGARGAQRVIITTGGRLSEIAAEEGISTVMLPKSRITRAALAFTFVALWRVFQKLDVFLPGDKTLLEAADFFTSEIDILSDLSDNDAVELAEGLVHTLPIIYSNDTLMAPVALRWKTQFNENSKMLAFRGEIPEMNHNEIEGWELTAHLMGKLSVIFLKDQSDHERVKRRMEVAGKLIEPHSVSLKKVSSTGNNALERVFYMIMYGDFVSFFLSILSEVDPMPIVKIELLKRKLEEM
ncbi:MAG: bifunctional phosphoglucose/phosphomannose isomerase [Balneolia bacterium]|nr:bifunctional phosphoglucose/phosphomannose isomerase [Balneolia bacterium]